MVFGVFAMSLQTPYSLIVCIQGRTKPFKSGAAGGYACAVMNTARSFNDEQRRIALACHLSKRGYIGVVFCDVLRQCIKEVVKATLIALRRLTRGRSARTP